MRAGRLLLQLAAAAAVVLFINEVVRPAGAGAAGSALAQPPPAQPSPPAASASAPTPSASVAAAPAAHTVTAAWADAPPAPRECSVALAAVAWSPAGATPASAAASAAVSSFTAAHGELPMLLVLGGLAADAAAPAPEGAVEFVAGSRNAAYLRALELGACAIWEAGEDVALQVPDLRAAVEAALAPVRMATAPARAGEAAAAPLAVYFGVRPRGASALDGSGGAVNMTSPSALLAPSRYMWPRGYPAALGERERSGDAASSPELVRMSVAPGDVALLGVAIAGWPDVAAAGGDGEPVAYAGRLPLVLLAPGVRAPLGAQASVARAAGLWTLYTPPSAPPAVADVWRGYIAQAVLGLCGLHVGFAPAWAHRGGGGGAPAAAAADDAADDARLPPLLVALAEWADARASECAAASDAGAARCHGAAFLEDAYERLAARGALAASDVAGVRAWLAALRALGVAFPPFRAPAPTTLLSPPRPPALDMRAAVHINWASSTAQLSVPMWHALFAAQFAGGAVYYVDLGTSGEALPAPRTFFSPHLVRPLPPTAATTPAGQLSGYFAYETFLAEWADMDAAGAAAGALLWTHDDLLTDPRALAAWLADAAQPCAALMDTGTGTDLLPPVAAWAASGFWWLPRAEIVAQGAAMLAAPPPCASRAGAPLADGHLWMGYSDGFAARRRCGSADDGAGTSDAFVAALARLRGLGIFLEIALHTAANCGLAPSRITKWPEFSLWTERRADPTAYLEASLLTDAPTPPVMHPLKLSDVAAVAVTAEIRDNAWGARSQPPTAHKASPIPRLR